MLEIDEKDLYQLLISEFRYAVQRDNHLAPGGCAMHIAEYLPKMTKQWRAHTAKQLTEEIIQARIWAHGTKSRLDYDAEWEKAQVFLLNYLQQLPYNADKYMQYIFNKPTWEANIDYFSVEIHNKIAKNMAKK